MKDYKNIIHNAVTTLRNYIDNTLFVDEFTKVTLNIEYFSNVNESTDSYNVDLKVYDDLTFDFTEFEKTLVSLYKSIFEYFDDNMHAQINIILNDCDVHNNIVTLF